MTLSQLNAKIARLPWTLEEPGQPIGREAAIYLRDERLGILGVHAGMEPTAAQIAIVHDELFPEPQKNLL